MSKKLKTEKRKMALHNLLKLNNASNFPKNAIQKPILTLDEKDRFFKQLISSENWVEIKALSTENEKWIKLQTPNFSSAFRQAAFALGLFETTDFHSFNQEMHEEGVKEGRCTGPYLCRSVFCQMWENTDHGKFQVKNHECYQMVMCIKKNQDENEVMGFYIWDRPHPEKRMEVKTEPVYDMRRKPQYEINIEFIGKGMFYVNPEFRGLGIGHQLAKQMNQEIKTWQKENPLSVQAIPAIVAIDRAQKLLKTVKPDFAVLSVSADSLTFRSKIWRLYMDDFDRDKRLFFDCVKQIPRKTPVKKQKVLQK